MANEGTLWRRVECNMWTDGWFVGLEPRAKLLFLYLVTSPGTTRAGVNEAPLALLQVWMGWSGQEEADEVFALLEPKVHRFDDGKVFVTNFLKVQRSRNNPALMEAGAVTDIRKESAEIQAAFFAVYPHLLDGDIAEPPAPPPQEAPKPARKPRKPKSPPEAQEAPEPPPEPEEEEAEEPEASVTVLPTPEPSAPKKLTELQQRREDLMVALGAEVGMGPIAGWTKVDYQNYSGLAKVIDSVGATPDDVHERAEMYRKYSDWVFTARSLVKYWTEIPNWEKHPPKQMKGGTKQGLAAELLDG